ncbi:MAG: ferrous iron transport protein B, partial [Desulfurobacteriaceae bacterium]
PFPGIPIFFLIMGLVFKLTFVFSSPISEFIDRIFSEFLPSFVLTNFSFLPKSIVSLINDGILAGVGSVIVFLPVLGVLYLLMSVLEDTGYMARAAALWDNFMRIFGLSGASVIPIILGFGCNVPAIYATKAMRSSSQRLITMLIIPWISCGARLPVYLLLTSLFFKEYQTLVILTLYAVGISLALLLAFILSHFLDKTKDDFFIELPRYKFPSWNVVFNQTFLEVKDFVYKAGTIIFAISVFIWALASLPTTESYAGENTLIGHVGKMLLPLFQPIGIEDWKLIVALIFGAVAKEVIVGTLGTLYSGEALKYVLSPEAALAYLFFVLLYIPCAATIAAIKQESGSWRWVIFSVVLELIVAYLVAFTVYRVAKVIF